MVEASVVAVVPVFNPDATLSERLRRLRRQVAALVIVDDGSTTPVIVDSDLADLPVITQSNSGIAAAINRGVALILSEVPEAIFVLTLDQDSDLDDDYVRNAVSAFVLAKRDGVKVAGVCAGKFNDWSVSPTGSEDGHATTLQVAQSGLLLSVDAVRRLGPLEEPLFIDCVDTEYVLRLLAAGEHIVIGADCRMSHVVGESVPLRLFGTALKWRGRERNLSYHSAIRRYYITRNRMVVYRRHLRTAPAWLARDTVLEARTLALSLIFGPRKRLQTAAVMFGIADGLRSRMGPVSPQRVKSLQVDH